MPKTDWNPILGDELRQPYWKELQQFISVERARFDVYPPNEKVFAALHYTPFSSVKVLILGQDPYHGPGQAHGLSFSVPHGIKPPPSLKNIFSELQTDLNLPNPTHGCLDTWAQQGVLLLNTTLTVRAHKAGSHQGKGWEKFTDRIIHAVNSKNERVVFVLWGSAAKSKKPLISSQQHVIVESPHPSPLSAHSGFFGSKPFSKINTALQQAGREPIDWVIPNLK